LRETPRPFAASVTDRPSGSRHSSLTISPDAAGYPLGLIHGNTGFA
jgi:hypothetical protein